MLCKMLCGSYVGLCFLQYDELVCDFISKNVEWVILCDEI